MRLPKQTVHREDKGMCGPYDSSVFNIEKKNWSKGEREDIARA